MGGFSQSFEKAYIPASASSSAAVLDAIKEKIKTDQAKAENKLQATTLNNAIITLAHQSGDPEMLKSAFTIVDAIGDSQPDASKLVFANIQSQIKDKKDFQQSMQKERYASSMLGISEIIKSLADRGGTFADGTPITPASLQDFGQQASERILARIGASGTAGFSQASQTMDTSSNLFNKPIRSKAEADIAEAAAKVSATKTAEKNVARSELRKELQDFFLLDDLVPRSKGGVVERTMQGVANVAASVHQSNATGFALATHDAARKRLRVKLVRAAGDVGNINIVEQVAAEQIIPTKFDSKGTAELKRAFLKEASMALETMAEGSELESEIKKVLNKFAESEAFNGPKGEEAKKLVKNWRRGEKFKYGGKTYVAKSDGMNPDFELSNETS